MNNTGCLSRTQVRGRLIARSKRNHQNQPLCWLCEAEVGSEMHEMINRGVTVGNELARLLSFQEGVTVLLDRGCHDQAPTHETEQKLWDVLNGIYGAEFVKNARQLVLDAMKSPVGRMEDEND